MTVYKTLQDTLNDQDWDDEFCDYSILRHLNQRRGEADLGVDDEELSSLAEYHCNH